MKECECCGNTYDKAFEVHIGGTTHTFDSFASAIHLLAPRCAHCKVPIIGHGMWTLAATETEVKICNPDYSEGKPYSTGSSYAAERRNCHAIEDMRAGAMPLIEAVSPLSAAARRAMPKRV